MYVCEHVHHDYVFKFLQLSQPCQKIPTDVTQRYTPDSYHSSLLQSYFIDFIKMIHNLLKKDAGTKIIPWEGPVKLLPV